MKLEEQGAVGATSPNVSEEAAATTRDRSSSGGGDAPATDMDEREERLMLEEKWANPPGFWGWLTSTDHKSIGKRYLITAFIFFIAGGLLAVTMRLQLARPENNLIGPDLYNQIFTMHGSTMMFLFAIPVMEAFAIYLIPL
ncbi:MAG TPA: cbb3-type cytochrome c oxidase subunit I, partial [Pyrinomonadaceae bacterium]|nr:cbb3-type cytochrome c oxidase subunit I [Pyrinomonadaceae bacterium]